MKIVVLVLCGSVAAGCISTQTQAQNRSAQDPDSAVTPEPARSSYKPVKITPDWAAANAAVDKRQLHDIDHLTEISRKASQGAPFLEKMKEWRGRAATAKVVVLFPAIAPSASETSFVTGETFYSFNADFEDGRHVNITGACAGIAPPGDSPLANRVRAERANRKTLERLGVPYRYSATEYGHSLNFSIFSCGYEVTLVCQKACDPEAELIAVANNLVIINRH